MLVGLLVVVGLVVVGVSGLLHRRRLRVPRVLRGGVGQSLDLQAPGGLDQGGQVLLEDVDLALVHVLEELFQVLGLYVLEEDDRVFVRTTGLGQDLTEEGAANAKHQLVGLKDLERNKKGLAVSCLGQSYVSQLCVSPLPVLRMPT